MQNGGEIFKRKKRKQYFLLNYVLSITVLSKQSVCTAKTKVFNKQLNQYNPIYGAVHIAHWLC